MASTILTRTPSSAGNRKTMTFSAWLKRSGISTGRIFSTSYSGENNQFWIKFGSETLGVYSRTGGTYTMAFDTTAKYRDTNGWYHLVVAIDTTQSTQADRLKVYVNGSLVSGNLSTAPSLNLDVEWNVAQPNDIGGKSDTNGEYFDGLMSHVHFCDGLALAPTVFGSTDSATGEWKINTNPSFTLGTNGFTILKDGNTITDQSSNSNNFSLDSGTLTKTEDNPSNVFAILNAITPSSNNNRAGGTRHFNNSGTYDMRHSTLAVSKGKWYAEFYMADMTGGFTQVGIQDTTQFNDYSFMTNSSRGYGYLKDGTKRNASSISSYGDTFTSGDYIGVAVDLDNNKIYFSKNGVWQNSGDPTSGATGTGSAFDIADGYDYCIATSSNDAGTDQITDVNFGNGYFNVNAVSSAGTNASGNGIFEYDVPTGYTALSTKGLNL